MNTPWYRYFSRTEGVASGAEPFIIAGTTAQYWRGDKTWQTLNKAAVGLSNVDNTSDATKNVLSATKLTTARTLGITGDLVWTAPSFDGSANVTAAGTLATVNANVGTFGSATKSITATFDAKGRATAVSEQTITPAASSITGGAALTKTDDTNVTVTLGGSPATALLAAVSLTFGWAGTLAISRGGTGVGSLSGLGNYVDDAAAAGGGVAVGSLYRNGSVLQVRIT